MLVPLEGAENDLPHAGNKTAGTPYKLNGKPILTAANLYESVPEQNEGS
jgi:hypothetical protein